MRRVASGIAVVMVGCLGLASAASAALVTIGSPLTGPFNQAILLKNVTVANVVLEAGTVTSPVDGTIVRWRISEAEGNYFRLRVMRRSFLGDYTAVTSSAPQLPEGGTMTYATRLPIKAGDTIGLDAVTDARLGFRSADPANALAITWIPTLAEGETRYPKESLDGREWAFNADVLPAPTVTAVTPSAGSLVGGTAVTIAGAGFTGAGAVSFGSVPATSFAVAGDGTITAVAPPNRPGPVDVTVTTIGGTSSKTAASAFTYTACVVPRLKWKSLKAAKRLLRRSDCKLGKVTKREGITAKTGDVVRQGKRTGRALPPGTEVGVTLGKRPPPVKD